MTMKIVLGALAGLAMAGTASATVLPPLASPSPGAPVIQVGEGCGLGWWRSGLDGRCRRLGWYAHGGRGTGCPAGWHVGTRDMACWPNR